MNTSRSMWILLGGAVLLPFTGCESGTGPQQEQEIHLLGETNDPPGDMVRRGADLVSGRVEVVGEEVLISIRWAPGTFIRDTSRVTLHLDLDQDPSTGSPGINSTGTVDADMIGAEFMFKFGPDGVGETDITRYNYIGAGNWNHRDLDCCISYSPDGLDATFPLAMLSGDDGRLNFKMVSGLKVSDTGFSRWLDVMPDVGLPAIPVDGG